jgi:hypothetical protein
MKIPDIDLSGLKQPNRIRLQCNLQHLGLPLATFIQLLRTMGRQATAGKRSLLPRSDVWIGKKAGSLSVGMMVLWPHSKYTPYGACSGALNRSDAKEARLRI